MNAPVLLLLNGAPGSGKSTLAALLAARRPLALALDVDQLKHSLGEWEEDLPAAGLQARRLALALAGRHLADGHDVLIGQYLARTAFLDQLEALAEEHGARFVEAALVADPSTLAERLAARRAAPDRPEQAANDRHVGPADAAVHATALDSLLAGRPRAHRLEAARPREELVTALSRILDAPEIPQEHP
ncbi:AAA family ATPase [Brachybacterium sp. J153]|uniref:AAA family ATPase n=1 Tax=Brachybacterium sp. J153 TaxID=3116488 RepID=UPI002E798176|nr:AAA family ATPase [Brachybacterium sp. J153]MEE1619208.1 AAA family ATPase [Brachybacterium sp. J153]